MGLGEGYEGLQKLEEGWGRVKEGKKGGFFVDMLNAVRQIQEENVGGSSRSTKIAFWKEQGLSGPSATTFVDIADKGNFDELLDNTKESKETLKGLKKAFQTEGEQLSELQKDQRDIIDGMAAVGRGILQLVSGLIGVIVAGIRSIPALIDYALLKLSPADDDGRADRIMEAITGMMSQQFATIAAGASSLADASVKLKDTVGEKIYKVFGENMRSAVTGDLSGYQAVEEMDIKELKSYIDDNTSLLKTAIQLFGADDMKRSAHEKRITADVSRAYARLDKLEGKILLKEEERVQGVTEDPYMGQNVPEGMYEPAVQTLISIEDIEAGLVAGDAKRNPGMGE